MLYGCSAIWVFGITFLTFPDFLLLSLHMPCSPELLLVEKTLFFSNFSLLSFYNNVFFLIIAVLDNFPSVFLLFHTFLTYPGTSLIFAGFPPPNKL